MSDEALSLRERLDNLSNTLPVLLETILKEKGYGDIDTIDSLLGAAHHHDSEWDVKIESKLSGAIGLDLIEVAVWTESYARQIIAIFMADVMTQPDFTGKEVVEYASSVILQSIVTGFLLATEGKNESVPR